MIPMTLARIAEVVGGTLADESAAEVLVTAPAALDNRAVEPGGLFVAVVGERVDGHDYAAAALEAGAAAWLGTRRVEGPGVLVEDPVAALSRLARHVVGAVGGLTVAALTGSAGKTGTKDYLAAVLAAHGETVATRGNHNNELGVPLTVLATTPTTRYLVVEMGARGRGHVAALCEVAPPAVAAVLNVGTAHVGEFGSREAIAVAKGEIVEALDPDGVAVLAADDPLVAPMASRTDARVLTWGTGAHGDVDVRHTAGSTDELGRATFELTHAGRTETVALRQPGVHQVLNATAAATMALGMGLDLADVAEALRGAEAASPWRMELHTRADGLVVINDAYNASPASTAAALDSLATMRRPGRRIAVLGEMRELGAESRDLHREVGRHAAELGLDVLVVVGEAGEDLAQGAREVAGWAGEAILTASREAATDWLRQNVTADDVVLVKASRGVALEHVAHGLLEGNPPR